MLFFEEIFRGVLTQLIRDLFIPIEIVVEIEHKGKNEFVIYFVTGEGLVIEVESLKHNV